MMLSRSHKPEKGSYSTSYPSENTISRRMLHASVPSLCVMFWKRGGYGQLAAGGGRECTQFLCFLCDVLKERVALSDGRINKSRDALDFQKAKHILRSRCIHSTLYVVYLYRRAYSDVCVCYERQAGSCSTLVGREVCLSERGTQLRFCVCDVVSVTQTTGELCRRFDDGRKYLAFDTPSSER